MKNTSFYFHWISFIVGFIFGVFGVLFSLFARTDRRDKVYSSLLIRAPTLHLAAWWRRALQARLLSVMAR